VIVDGRAGGFTKRTDVCVVGSGAGGGVAAGLLAEAGRSVIVLEEGPHVPTSQMTQREGEMYARLYRDGGSQSTDDGGVTVLQGRVMGGSTVVNMADVVPISDGVLAHWRVHHGVDRFSVADLRTAEAACRAAIGANPIPPEQVNSNNALLLRGARALGLDGGAFDHNRVGCVGAGACLLGCAFGAKQSVALTWIPRALRTERCTVHTECRLERFETQARRVTAAVGSVIDTVSGAVLAPFRVEAEQFVLAAGAVHSPVLLRRSGLGGPHVGRWLSLQPQVPVAAVFPHETVPFRGIPQSTFVDSAERHTEAEGLGGFRLEGIASPPGMGAVALSAPIRDVHEFMAAFRRSASCLCLVPDRPVGRVDEGSDGRPRIRYALTDAVERTLREAAGVAARAWLAAGAEAVLLPLPGASVVRTDGDLAQLDGLRFRPASSHMISAHPQGTCRMGPDPKTSVVDPELRVHGIDNLRVMDASVFPTSASSHTMLPVMAFAHLAAMELSRRP
jgi:choline dehydrogenase-like flavoprotein